MLINRENPVPKLRVPNSVLLRVLVVLLCTRKKCVLIRKAYSVIFNQLFESMPAVHFLQVLELESISFSSGVA
jgi:hypothetical protein